MGTAGRKAALAFALTAALAAIPALMTPRHIRGEGTPVPGYTIAAKGWNLISTGTAVTLDVPSAESPLYTLQPGSDAYQALTWAGLRPGYGYWAFFRENTAVRLPPSSQQRYSVDAPPGQWIMVGNPSTSGSARVAGADQVLVYSPLTGYRDDALIPVGYGAFVRSVDGGTITVEARADDAPPIDFPSCCLVGPGDYHGQAHIDLLDDSPFALFYGVRAVAADGSFPRPTASDYGYGAVPACESCSEYSSAPSACRVAATSRTVEVTPGQYLIRLTADGDRVPDIILVATLQPNMRYYFCRWVGSGRT